MSEGNANQTDLAGYAPTGSAPHLPGQETYVLRLYITGHSPNSRRAVENVRTICDEYLEGRYELEIIDIYQQPALAQKWQIVAAPTLVKESPPPLRKFIGNMSKTERILRGLDLDIKK